MVISTVFDRIWKYAAPECVAPRASWDCIVANRFECLSDIFQNRLIGCPGLHNRLSFRHLLDHLTPLRRRDRQGFYLLFLSEQRQDGSWDYKGKGSDYCTAMMVLSFSVPYRQLPIYQRDETVDEE